MLVPTVLRAVVQRVSCRVGLAVRGSRGTQGHRLTGHVRFGVGPESGNGLDAVTVEVARAEVHLRIDAARVVAQGLLDTTQGFDKLAPVHRAQEAQAADAVAHGHLVGGLLLAFHVHELFDRLPRLGQALFDPRQWQRQRGTLPLQPARVLGHKGVGQRRSRTRHVGHHQDQVARRVMRHVEHGIGPAAGGLALGVRNGHAGRDAAQIVDQGQPQHDRTGPQLTQAQRLHRLVGRDEAAQGSTANLSIAMGHGLQRKVIDARQPRADAIGRFQCEFRQFTAVAARQMPARGADFFFDEIEVVEQPFRRRREAAVRVCRRGEAFAEIDQDPLVRCQSGQQSVRQRCLAQHVLRGKALTVQYHLLGTEELSA